MSKTKKIFLIVMGLVGLVIAPLSISFFQTINSEGYKNAQRYYFKVPFIKPNGNIVFASNRLCASETASASHSLHNGAITLNPGHIVCPKYLQEADLFTVNYKSSLQIRNRNFEILNDIDVFKKYNLTSYDVSPDGKKIAFIIRDDPRKEIPNLYVSNIDGSEMKKITHKKPPHNIACANPKWSPDGSQIVFEYEPDDSDESTTLYLVNADGTNLHRLIDCEPSEYRQRLDPIWSPNGEWIAYSTYEDIRSSRNIFIVKSDGTGNRQLSFSPFSKREPYFSPDGKYIICTAHPHSLAVGELWVIDVATGQEYRVLKHEKSKVNGSYPNDFCPIWID